ncbi:MAG: YceI family protein [Acidimicrobiia bacterium]|nr:YceI family protein [Acidimicrobiia bacterium]
MSDYTYDPRAWHPLMAGAVAGAIGGVVASLLALTLRSPDEVVANSVSITVISILLGVVSGALWRRIRASNGAVRTFAWTMAGGFVVAMMAASLGHLFILDGLIGYAAAVAVVVFLTLGFLVPVCARITAPWWVGVVAVGVALLVAIALFGRGNVASGELSFDDLPSGSTTTLASGATVAGGTKSTPTTSPGAALTGTISIPDDLAASYTVTTGIVTYEVPEVLQGLSTVGVGQSDTVTGSILVAGAFAFALDLQSFESDQRRRDSRVRGWFADFPEGTFASESFELPTTAEVGVPVTFDVTGTLTINDINEETTWTVEARIEPDGSLSILADTDIVLSVFDVPVQTGGFVEMEDAAHLEVLISAIPD